MVLLGCKAVGSTVFAGDGVDRVAEMDDDDDDDDDDDGDDDVWFCEDDIGPDTDDVTRETDKLADELELDKKLECRDELLDNEETAAGEKEKHKS